jgi:acid phosphatase type 7
MLGTYADWGPSSRQRAWLAADLAGLDRDRTPWLIVGMHAPWYSSNTAHLDEVDAMRASLEPLLLEHGADLVFCGHVHSYERIARVARRKRHACGPAHVIVGDGGNREGLSLHWLDPQPAWSLFREASFGHGALTLVNATHARWEWVRNQDGVGARPGDAAWFVRGDGGGECTARDRASLVAGAVADAVAVAAVPGRWPGARTTGVGFATETLVAGGGGGAAAAAA